MNYRRIPIEVEAVQFKMDEQNCQPFFTAFNYKFPVLRQWKQDFYILVPTKYGPWVCNNGDWLVLEKDYMSVVKKDKFAELFESL